MEAYDDTLRPVERQTTATPGMFCNPCMAAGKVGILAHRVIIKNGKPWGLCKQCYEASRALRPEPEAIQCPQADLLDEAIEDPAFDLEASEEQHDSRTWSRQKKVVDVKAFRLDYQSGLPWGNLIQKYGSRTKLYQVMRENGIAKRPDRFRPPATEHQRKIGRDSVMRRKIQIDEAALISDYKAGTPVKELSERYGLFASGVYARLKKAGVNGTRKRPAETARMPRQARPSARMLARVNRQADKLTVAGDLPEVAPENQNGKGTAAHIRFRVVDCELGGNDATLAEGLRALTAALSKR